MGCYVCKSQKNIFNRFYQVDQSRDAALGGSGIGLALTQDLVKLQGGEIGLDSVEGEGSTFWFLMPTTEISTLKEESNSKSAAESGENSNDIRMLVVEDNDINLAMLLDVLKIRNFNVCIARNGKTGIQLAESENPAIILMDINMPVMGGIEAVRILRSKEQFASIPIIALTADADQDSIGLCLEAGYTCHVGKPFRVAELFKTIEDCLGMS